MTQATTNSTAPTASDHPHTGWQRCTDGTLICLQWRERKIVECARATDWADVQRQEHDS